MGLGALFSGSLVSALVFGIALGNVLLGLPFRSDRNLRGFTKAIDLLGLSCQSAFKFDPGSASNFDPFERAGLGVALVSSELAGVAETRRARVA